VDALCKWQEFLNNLLRATTATKDKARQCLIIELSRWRATTPVLLLSDNTWTHLHQAAWPIYLFQIPVPDSRLLVQETAKMVWHLLECSHTDFRQVHGTPFTTPALSDLLGFDGLTPLRDLITKGDPIPSNIPLNPATWLLLKHQQSLLLPNGSVEHPIDFDLLMKGFKNWPECTTTSPSGRHLGYSKTFLQATLLQTTNHTLMALI